MSIRVENDCSKQWIVQMEQAKILGNHMDRLETLKDSEAIESFKGIWKFKWKPPSLRRLEVQYLSRLKANTNG